MLMAIEVSVLGLVLRPTVNGSVSLNLFEYPDELPIVDLTSQGSPARASRPLLSARRPAGRTNRNGESEYGTDEGPSIPVPTACRSDTRLGYSREHSMCVVRDLMLRSIRHPAVRLYRAERSEKGYSIGRRDLGLANGRSAVKRTGIMDLEAMIDLSLNLLA